jgi:hypothetical protein
MGLAAVLPGSASRPVAKLERCWVDLASADGAAAYRAMGQLAAIPGHTVPFLNDRLRPVAGPSRERLAQLIAGLGSDRYTVRDKAQQELEQLQDVAEEELTKALGAGPSLEVRRRLERLLARLDLLRSPERLRALRAIEVLEQIGTPEAKQVLQKLAEGAPEAQLTREARGSLERLARRAACDGQ